MGSWGCFPGAVLERDPVSFYNVVSDFHLDARFRKNSFGSSLSV
jgi:hypothetical protein